MTHIHAYFKSTKGSETFGPKLVLLFGFRPLIMSIIRIFMCSTANISLALMVYERLTRIRFHGPYPKKIMESTILFDRMEEDVKEIYK